MTPEDAARYDRQIRLPEVGVDGQEALSRASVLLVGAGGLGSPAALYLAASGVGRIGLIDADRVDTSNLQRQVLYGESDVGERKVDAARARLQDLNPNVRIDVVPEWFSADNARGLVSQYDVVLDGTDSFAARYLVNDACVLEGVAYVSASVSSFEGQLLTVVPGEPCYRCVFPEPPPAALAPSCAEAGVLGVTPGLLGVLQATEALKLILGIGTPLTGTLLLADTLSMRFRTIQVDRDADCRVCGASGEIRTMAESAQVTQAACGAPSESDETTELSPSDLKRRLDAGDPITLVDVRNPNEHAYTDIGGILIPLPFLSNRVDELEPFRNSPIAVYCRSGGRSSVAVSMLRARGFDARSLTGGILAWGREVDPTVKPY